MRTSALFLLFALALSVGQADAAKPNDTDLKRLAGEADRSCRGTVDGLPGAPGNYNVLSICQCAHGGSVAGLRTLDLDKPAAPTKADHDKIASINNHAIWACAQPSYAKALAQATAKECGENVGNIASAKDLSDVQKHELCTCVGDTFAQSADLTKVAETTPGKMQTFADDVLQKAYSACKAKETAKPAGQNN